MVNRIYPLCESCGNEPAKILLKGNMEIGLKCIKLYSDLHHKSIGLALAPKTWSNRVWSDKHRINPRIERYIKRGY